MSARPTALDRAEVEAWRGLARAYERGLAWEGSGRTVERWTVRSFDRPARYLRRYNCMGLCYMTSTARRLPGEVRQRMRRRMRSLRPVEGHFWYDTDTREGAEMRATACALMAALAEAGEPA